LMVVNYQVKSACLPFPLPSSAIISKEWWLGRLSTDCCRCLLHTGSSAHRGWKPWMRPPALVRPLNDGYYRSAGGLSTQGRHAVLIWEKNIARKIRCSIDKLRYATCKSGVFISSHTT
jgi:hypothetical protein